MKLSYIVEQLINGICQGSIYALFATGYTLIAGVIGLVSFTYGEIVMLGAFSAYYFSMLVIDNLFLCVLVSFAVGGLLGILVHKVCYERFLNAPKYISMICTIGMGMMLRNLAQAIFGSDTKGMTELLQNGVIRIGEFRISYIQIVVILVVILISITLSFVLSRTKTGIMLRAVSQNKKASALVGINVNYTIALGNVIGCGIAAVGGLLFAIYYGSISPMMSSTITVKAFSAAILGGMSDIPAAATGGVGIGIIENFGIMVVGTSIRDLVAFICLILALLFKPQGFHIGKGKMKV